MNARQYVTAAAPFEAARQVECLPEGHRARRLHGHGFLARIRAEVASAASPVSDAEEYAARLTAEVAALDYRLLNDLVPVPTDENLARWLRERLRLPGLDRVGIQSTRDQGVDLDGRDHAHVWRRFRLEAAHQLPKVPPGHPGGRMHGHGFEVILHADQDLNGQDLGVDYDHLAAVWAPLHRQLHYRCLNDLPGLDNPTSERLAAWLWERLASPLPELDRIDLDPTPGYGAMLCWGEEGPALPG